VGSAGLSVVGGKGRLSRAAFPRQPDTVRMGSPTMDGSRLAEVSLPVLWPSAWRGRRLYVALTYWSREESSGTAALW